MSYVSMYKITTKLNVIDFVRIISNYLEDEELKMPLDTKDGYKTIEMILTNALNKLQNEFETSLLKIEKTDDEIIIYLRDNELTTDAGQYLKQMFSRIAEKLQRKRVIKEIVTST